MNLNHLNKKQIEAVLAQGIVRIIAGAGSGKTRVLTYRIAYLISEHVVNPSNILAVTFTRKAAGEIKERLQRIIGEKVSLINCGTFHSLCYRILKESSSNTFQVLDERKRKLYLMKVLGPQGINLDLEPGRAGSIISLAKNQLMDAERFAQEAEDNFMMEKLAKAFILYEQWKERDMLLDYDDLLLKCWGLLETELPVLHKYQQRFSYILVDEFQDTNLAQFEIIRLLTPPQDNLFVVGDDWQSIYTWRGAVPENIIEFENSFPQVITIKLEQNYRSTKTILTSSNRLISFNKMRTKKKLWTKNSKGNKVEIFEAEDLEHEAFIIIEEVRSLVSQNGLTYKDIAILYRTNSQSRSIEDECIKQKIPYTIIGSPGFYNYREVKDMTVYLRLIHDLKDDDALKRIINVPPRYLGRAFMSELERRANSHKLSLFESLDSWFSRPYMMRCALDFQALILKLRNLYQKGKTTLPDLLREIRRVTDYDRYICKDEEPTPENSRIQNLKELESALVRFESIEDFLFYGKQLKRSQRNHGEDRNRISLMTLHKSKGAEYSVVFLAGCSQGILPHHNSLENGQIEEERRLCYVGMTRAMERLYISYLRSYQGREMGISQFLKETFAKVN